MCYLWSISQYRIGFGLSDSDSDRINALLFGFGHGSNSRRVVGFGLGLRLGKNGSDWIGRSCRIRRPALMSTLDCRARENIIFRPFLDNNMKGVIKDHSLFTSFTNFVK